MNNNERNKKCNKSCKDCTFPCINQGGNLTPITSEQLEQMGYIICDNFTTEQDDFTKEQE